MKFLFRRTGKFTWRSVVTEVEVDATGVNMERRLSDVKA